MIAIATTDQELANKLGSCLQHDRCYITAARNVDDLRRQIRKHTATVALIDARFGGESFDALGAVPRLGRVAAVALVASGSQVARDVALRLGCFEVVDTSAADFRQKIARAVALAVVWKRSARRQWECPASLQLQ